MPKRKDDVPGAYAHDQTANSAAWERAHDLADLLVGMSQALERWQAAEPGDWGWIDDAPPVTSDAADGDDPRDVCRRALLDLARRALTLDAPARQALALALQAGRLYESTMVGALDDVTRSGRRNKGPTPAKARNGLQRKTDDADTIRLACVQKHYDAGLGITEARKAAVTELAGTAAECKLSVLEHLPGKLIRRKRKGGADL